MNSEFFFAGGKILKPLPPLLPFKASFVIPNALPGIPYGDGARLWTPAFTIYDDKWQGRMLDKYLEYPYTHFVYNVARTYHGDYPEPDPLDDPKRVRKDLLRIRAAGLIPVVAACDDQDDGNVIPWRAVYENADLIPVVFPMWEMNGPLGVADRQPDGSYMGRIIDCIANTHEAVPNARLYLHFTAGHGAPGYPEERQSWVYVRDHYRVAGLFSQDDGFDRNSTTGDPVGTAAGLADTAARLATIGLDNVAFEQCTTPVYHLWHGWDEARQRAYGKQLMELAPNTAGYCDGGF